MRKSSHPTKQNKITLIISPSCSGKSTYIEQINSDSKPVLLGNELKVNETNYRKTAL